MGNNAPGITWNKVLNGKKHFESIVDKSGSWENRKELLHTLIGLLESREKYIFVIDVYFLHLFLT